MSDAWYLVVNGVLWLRHTSQPRAVWFADFVDTPSARREPYDGELPFGDRLTGSCGDARWELTLGGGGSPTPYFPGWLRPIAATNVTAERPAVRVDGWFEAGGVRHELHDAPGETALVRTRRHADEWGWFHAALPDGGWVDGLVGRAKGLPQVAFHLRDGKRTWARGVAAPGRTQVGPYVVEAPHDSFVGVTYLDPGGGAVYCWHSERGRLTGPGVEAEHVALEYGSRARVDGWPISI
jgi:hypothetical protein